MKSLEIAQVAKDARYEIAMGEIFQLQVKMEVLADEMCLDIETEMDDIRKAMSEVEYGFNEIQSMAERQEKLID